MTLELFNCKTFGTKKISS